MQTPALNTKTPASHIYHQTWQSALRIYLGSLVFAAGIMLLIGRAIHMAWGSTIFLLAVLTVTRWFRRGRGASLHVTPEGFTYRSMGLWFSARWTDVARIGPAPYAAVRWLYGETLVVPGGVVPLHSPMFGTYADRWPRCVPLAWFAPQWRTSALGDDIRQYAPWLIEAR